MTQYTSEEAIEKVREVTCAELSAVLDALYTNNWNIEGAIFDLVNAASLRAKLLASAAAVPCLHVHAMKLSGLKHTGMHRLEIVVNNNSHWTGWIPGGVSKPVDALFEFRKFEPTSHVAVHVWHRRLIRKNKCVGTAKWKLSYLSELPSLYYCGSVPLYHKQSRRGTLQVEIRIRFFEGAELGQPGTENEIPPRMGSGVGTTLHRLPAPPIDPNSHRKKGGPHKKGGYQGLDSGGPG